MKFKDRIKHQFNRAAPTYDQAASLQSKSTELLLSLLPDDAPKYILDVGTGTGSALPELKQKYPYSQVYALDFSESMLLQGLPNKAKGYIVADYDYLPFYAARFDLLFANLSLQWSLDFNRTLAELSRVLNARGLLVFSTLIQGSLIELNRTHFLKADEVQHALAEAGFEVHIQQFETKQFYFKSFTTALQSLKQVGANASANQIQQGLAARGKLKALEAACPRHIDLSYPLTYELMYVAAGKKSV